MFFDVLGSTELYSLAMGRADPETLRGGLDRLDAAGFCGPKGFLRLGKRGTESGIFLPGHKTAELSKLPKDAIPVCSPGGREIAFYSTLRPIIPSTSAQRTAIASIRLAAECVDGTAGGVKEWAAWLTEKVSRLKLKHGSADGLGKFEALEFLVLGIHGKRALWRAMAVIAPLDSRLQDLDFAELITRAESQHQRVEERRLACAQSVFRLATAKGK